MILARPVISPFDRRVFQIQYPWLSEEEVITTVTVGIIPPPEDTETPPRLLFDPMAAISPDGKSLYFRTDYDDVVGPPIDGTEYVVNILVRTSLDQENYDSLIFIIDDKVCR